jgi:hypothetical protein
MIGRGICIPPQSEENKLQVDVPSHLGVDANGRVAEISCLGSPASDLCSPVIPIHITWLPKAVVILM